MQNCKKDYDIEKICRCCLNSVGEMKPLYGYSLDKMLCEIADLQVEHKDGLPELLCFQCVLQLSRAFRFRVQCKQSDRTIRNYIKRQSEVQQTKDGSEQAPERLTVEECMITGVVSDRDEVLDEEYELESDVPTKSNVYDNPVRIDLNCNVCEKQFTTRKQLIRHLKTHDDNKPNKCPECDKSFAEKCNLKKHMLKHTGELRKATVKPHLCSICGHSFKYSSSLSKHMKFHTGKSLHYCPHCPKFYVEKTALAIHLRCHTGERPHACSECNQRFSQACNLQKHLRTHSGKRPFTCLVCGRSFAERDYLVTHIQTHNPQKNSLCNVCGKRFSNSKTLEAHLRTHASKQPYKCDLDNCNRTFTRLDTMRIHQRIHSGEKPYTCDMCDHKFTTSTQLSNHKRTHTGEKPFSCELCPKKFTSKKSLKSHAIKHDLDKQQEEGNELSFHEETLQVETITEQVYEESVLLFKINESGKLVLDPKYNDISDAIFAKFTP